MTDLSEPLRLVPPTTAVRASYLAGELADCLHRGTPTEWLGPAADDFDGFVADRLGVLHRWGVPFTTHWWVSGENYIGTLALRHRLTPALTDEGGHIGFHVVAPWHRQGHATRMLAAGLVEARRIGLRRALLTCLPENEASRRVIVANGGVPAGRPKGEDRFWIHLEDESHAAGPGPAAG